MKKQKVSTAIQLACASALVSGVAWASAPTTTVQKNQQSNNRHVPSAVKSLLKKNKTDQDAEQLTLQAEKLLNEYLPKSDSKNQVKVLGLIGINRSLERRDHGDMESKKKKGGSLVYDYRVGKSENRDPAIIDAILTAGSDGLNNLTVQHQEKRDKNSKVEIVASDGMLHVVRIPTVKGLNRVQSNGETVADVIVDDYPNQGP